MMRLSAVYVQIGAYMWNFTYLATPQAPYQILIRMEKIGRLANYELQATTSLHSTASYYEEKE
jgi:hypothetical protein